MQVNVRSRGTALTEALAQMLGSKRKQDEANRAEGRDDEMLRLRGEESRRGDASLQLQRDANTAAQSDRAADNSRADAQLDILRDQNTRAGDKATHDRQEHDDAAIGLRQRLHQLNPKIDPATLNSLDYDSLRSEIDGIEGGQRRISEIHEAHQLTASQNLEQVRRQQVIANTNLMTVKRFRDDTYKRIQSDPTLMNEAAQLMAAGEPNAYAKIATKLTGRDLESEYMLAGQQVQAIGQQAFVIGGNAAGPSPLTQRAVNENLPFQLLPPDQQAQVAAGITARLKAGQPIDMVSAQSRGIPISVIAQQAGMHVDANGTATAVAAAPTQIAPPVAPGSTSSIFSGGAGGYGVPGGTQIQPPAAQPSSSVQMQPVGAGVDPAQSLSQRLGGLMQNPQPQGMPAPQQQLGVSMQPTSSAAVIPPPSNPFAAFNGAGNPGGSAETRKANLRAQLSTAAGVNDALAAANELVNMGDDYNSVISAIPLNMRALVAAKVPKRIPSAPTPQPTPGGPGGMPPISFSPPPMR